MSMNNCCKKLSSALLWWVCLVVYSVWSTWKRASTCRSSWRN